MSTLRFCRSILSARYPPSGGRTAANRAVAGDAGRDCYARKPPWRPRSAAAPGPALLLAGGDARRLEVAPELPHGLKELRIRGVPKAAPVQIGAHLPDRGHQLARTHLGDGLGQRSQGGE